MPNHDFPCANVLVIYHDAQLQLHDNDNLNSAPLQFHTEFTQHMHNNHHHNTTIWQQEDLARRTWVSDAEIVANKRQIDKHNQARNNAIESMDACLLAALAKLHVPFQTNSDVNIRQNSETAGSMVDRLSILALKIHAMTQQSLRSLSGEKQQQLCQANCLQLQQQRTHLAACFDQLLHDMQLGVACFKLHKQFKMYNDPNLNPILQMHLQMNSKPSVHVLHQI